jgi:hypothetical protein
VKRFLLIVLVVLSLLLTACGSSSPASSASATSTDAYGNRIIKSQHDIAVYPKELPCYLTYNDEAVIVKDIRLYQMEANYEHTLFAIVEIDLSELSDKSYHWIFEDKDLSYNVYLDGGKNKFDFATMGQLGAPTSYTDTKCLKICWATSFFDKYKEDFDGTEVVLSVFAEQEEGVPYHISFRPNTDTIPGLPPESDEDYQFIGKKLQDEKRSWEGFDNRK